MNFRFCRNARYKKKGKRFLYSEVGSLHRGFAATTAKSLQSCPTLCDPIDGSPPGSSVHGLFQARALEWGAIAFSIWDGVVGVGV